MQALRGIMAATDGSPQGAWAVETGAALARRAQAGFDIVTVVDAPSRPAIYRSGTGEAFEHDDMLIGTVRRRAKAQAREAGMPGAPVHVGFGSPAPLINQVADGLDVGLIVVGARPLPGLVRSVVGSTAERVIRLAQRPVLVATEPRSSPFNRILTAIDLSPQSSGVLATAAAIARADRAELHILHVTEPLPEVLIAAAQFGIEELERYVRSEMDRLISEANPPARTETLERGGYPGAWILEEAANWDADLIVVGSHGFGFFNRLLLGSTSLYVLRNCGQPTLVVPRTPARTEEERVPTAA